jgi:hypothetical protein
MKVNNFFNVCFGFDNYEFESRVCPALITYNPTSSIVTFTAFPNENNDVSFSFDDTNNRISLIDATAQLVVNPIGDPFFEYLPGRAGVSFANVSGIKIHASLDDEQDSWNSAKVTMPITLSGGDGADVLAIGDSPNSLING